MRSKRCTAAVLAAALVALASCGDGFTIPERATAPEDPSHIALLLPSVHHSELAAREAAKRQQTLLEIQDGTSNTFAIGEWMANWAILADGTALGVLQLWLNEGAGQPETFVPVEGRLFCSNGAPASELILVLPAQEREPARTERLTLSVESLDPAEVGRDSYRLQHTLQYPDGKVLTFEATATLWLSEDPCDGTSSAPPASSS